MINKMKSFTVVLVIVMGLALLAGCGKKEEENKTPGKDPKPPTEQNGKDEPVSNFNLTGLPIVNEKVTVKMIGIQGPSSIPNQDLAFFKEYEKMTNVHVEIESIPQDANEERKSLMFAGNKLPEALMLWLTDQEVLEYGANGTLLALEDLIAEYAPNIQAFLDNNPEYRKMLTTPEGHIYSLPHITDSIWQVVYPMSINKKWLDELDLKVPNNLDELYNVLVAFRDNKGPDVIPFNFDPPSLIRFFSNGFGLTHNNYMTVLEDGKVIPIVKHPKFKEALEFYSKLYSEKLMSPEVFSMTLPMMEALGHEGKLGAFFGPSSRFGGAEYTEDYVILPPLEYDGKRTTQYKSPLERGIFAITNAAKNPEIIIRWVDYLFTEEGSKLAFYGPEGMGYENYPDGTWSALPAPADFKGASYLGTLTPRQGGSIAYDMSDEIFSRQVDHPSIEEPMYNSLTADLIREHYMPYIEEGLPMAFMTKEEAEIAGPIQADYNNFVLQLAGAMIMDKNNFNNWDSFMETADKIGVDKLAEVYQQVLDRWNSMD